MQENAVQEDVPWECYGCRARTLFKPVSPGPLKGSGGTNLRQFVGPSHSSKDLKRNLILHSGVVESLS